MRVAGRRALLAGAGTLVGASLATLLLRRKPGHPIEALAAGAPDPTSAADALAPVLPPAAMPVIAFRDESGGAHGLAEFVGRGVVLNVWATWCGPCVAEMPSLAALARKLAADGIVVLPLSIDRGGAPAVQAFYAAHGIAGLGVWTDDDGRSNSALAIEGVPTTFVIDRHGRKVGLLEGGADWGSDAAAAAVRGLIPA